MRGRPRPLEGQGRTTLPPHGGRDRLRERSRRPLPRGLWVATAFGIRGGAVPPQDFGWPTGQPPAKANAMAGTLPDALLGTRTQPSACAGRVRFPQTPEFHGGNATQVLDGFGGKCLGGKVAPINLHDKSILLKERFDFYDTAKHATYVNSIRHFRDLMVRSKGLWGRCHVISRRRNWH
jgi:hypothetical protein